MLIQYEFKTKEGRYFSASCKDRKSAIDYATRNNVIFCGALVV